MNPKDIAILLEEIQKRGKIAWTSEERLLMDLAKKAVRQERWLSGRDAFILQAMYRKSQGSRI